MPTEAGPVVPLTGFYLDTSAVRALPDRKKQLAGVGAFTSVFTLLELLDGATTSPDEYRRRRAAIRRVLESGMHIVPDMPQVSLTRAFPELAPYYAWRYDDHLSILRLAEAITKTELPGDFHALQTADAQWQSVRQSWADLAARTVADSQSERGKFWKLMEDATPAELAQYGIDPALTTRERFAQFIVSPVNIAASRYVLVLKALESLKRPEDHALGARIDASWNGQGQPYMRVMAIRHLGRLIRKETASGNDAYDQDHFAYIEPDVWLITNDSYMAELARFVRINVGNSETLSAAIKQVLDDS